MPAMIERCCGDVCRFCCCCCCCLAERMLLCFSPSVKLPYLALPYFVGLDWIAGDTSVPQLVTPDARRTPRSKPCSLARTATTTATQQPTNRPSRSLSQSRARQPYMNSSRAREGRGGMYVPTIETGWWWQGFELFLIDQALASAPPSVRIGGPDHRSWNITRALV